MSVLLPLFVALSPWLAAVEEPFAELSFEAALEQAGKEERLVMIDFFTTWCGPCKRLDAVTWKDDGVRAWLAQHTVALKIDAEKQVDLASRLRVEAYPSMVFIRPDGSVQGRIVGYKDPAAFLLAAQDVLKGVRPSERIRAELEAAGGNDPALRQRLGQELTREGRHAEALEQYLWCFDHGVEHQSSYVGVRVSFLLSSLTRLGHRYPPALEALRERRDKAQEFMGGSPPAGEMARDFAVLNQALGEDRLTLQVYDQLAEGDAGASGGKATRAVLFRHVFDLLLEARRYGDVVAGVGLPLPQVQRKIESYRRTKELLDDDEAAAYMKTAAIEAAARYYEAFAGTRENDEQAQEIVDLLLAFDSNPSTWDALIQHAKRAERPELADELALLELEVR